MGAEVNAGNRAAQVARVARGAWYGLLAQAVDKMLPVAIILYLARELPGEQFGLYAFLIAYLAFFQIAAEQSLDTVLVRILSQAPPDRVAILNAAAGLRLLAAVIAAVAATVLAIPVSGGRTSFGLALLASLSMVTAMGSTYRAYFRAELNIRAVLLIALTRAVLLAVAVVVAVRLAPGVHAVFASAALANLLAFGLVALAVRGAVPFRLVYAPAIWSRLARGAAPLAINAFAITLGLRAGHILLMSMRGPTEVGLLGAASRVAEAFTLLPEALMITVYPLMAGLHGNDLERLVKTARRSTRYLVIATGVPVVLCAVAGSEVMGVLFGPAFAEAGSVLAILSFMALFGATGTVILNLLIAVHHERTLYRNTLVFALANVAACVPLIRGWGYLGAAVAMLGSSAASQISLALLPSTGPYVRPCLVAGAASALAVCLAATVGKLSGLSALPASLIAVVCYAAALVLFGVLNRDEIRFVRSVFAAASHGSGE